MPDPSPHLGLVCITSNDEIRYRTITRTYLLKHDPALRGDRLTELYRSNLTVLGRSVDWCQENHVQLYRIPSSLFPFADSPYGSSILESLAPELSEVGAKIARTGLRVVCHPDQFVVLSSDSRAVVENSRAMLAFQGKVMDLLGLPRSAWATIEIHGGKGDRSEQLIRVIEKLEPSVRTRLALENDERTYGAEEILRICRQAEIPMVFDAHHHVVKEKLTSYDDPSVEKFLQEAASTWPDPAWQLVHISNGREGISDLRHHDFIDVMPQSYARAPWIEVEAKLKEQAIARLRSNWGPARQTPGLRTAALSKGPEAKKITWTEPKNVSDAARIQRELRSSIRIQPLDSPIRLIAGADISFDRGSDWFHAAWVVLDAKSLQVVEEAGARVKSTFPYVPGYLSFREIPALLEAYSKLKQAPDVIVVDGQGIAHPRRLGIATHLGLVLDVPTLGCGKSPLYGRYSDPGPNPGDRSPILDPRTGERLGTAYRSRARSLPLILSPGHRTDVDDSVRIVEGCLRGYRIPEPTRLAHLAANRLRREAQGAQAA